MQDRDRLIVANLLNGIAPSAVAAAFGVDLAQTESTFASAMKLVAEYRLVHCVPHFESGTLEQARAERVRVLEILGRIERWDAYERDLMLDLLKKKDLSGYGKPRKEIQEVLQRTLDALPAYLREKHLTAYFHDRKAFIAEHPELVIEAVEKFISFRNPIVYKNFKVIGMDPQNAERVDNEVHSLTH
jgi:hypothetical protein